MSKVVWSPHALRDVARLFEFIRRKNPQAAGRAAQQIKKAALLLAQKPLLGKPMEGDDVRRELSTAFGKRGYVLRYRCDGEDVFILRVWHYLELRD